MTWRDATRKLGKLIQNLSPYYRVGEHPDFGGVYPVHAGDSYHYTGQALDINADNAPEGEASALDALYYAIKKAGLSLTELIWRSSGHYDHLHVALGEPDDPRGLYFPTPEGIPADTGRYTLGTSSGGDTVSAAGGKDSFTYNELGQLWIAAGGAPAMAPTMAAIALAESGGNRYSLAGPVDIRPVKEGTYRYTTGENSVGLWQINVQAHPQYNAMSLFDPMANARAAVAVLGGGSPTPWSTYTNHDYEKYLKGNITGTYSGSGGNPNEPIERPDIPNQNASFTGSVTGAFHDVTGFFGKAAGWSWGLFDDWKNAVVGFAEAMIRMVSFFINPLNWLRAVEFVIGIWLVGLGIYVFIRASDDEKFATLNQIINSDSLSSGGRRKTPTGTGQKVAKRSGIVRAAAKIPK